MIELGNIRIGQGERPLVIPDIGINHNGSLSTAKEMVDAAYRAGARLIKHQTHIVADEMVDMAKNIIPGNANISIYEIMESCMLCEEEEIELKQYTESLGLLYLSTPFSRAAADRLEKMGVLGYKIGSGELNNYPLLDYIASFGKPMIVSTGMNGMSEIGKAVEILKNRKIPFALLHTTNLYPTPARLVRLGAMQQLKKCYPDIPIGLSDHTINNYACMAAIALGADIIERHFTDSKKRNGPDIVCSMDEEELKILLQASSEISLMSGGCKEAAKEEDITMKFAFSSVVTIKEILKGQTFDSSNIWVKRPGIGELRASDYKNILGHKAKTNICAGVLLSKDLIE